MLEGILFILLLQMTSQVSSRQEYGAGAGDAETIFFFVQNGAAGPPWRFTRSQSQSRQKQGYVRYFSSYGAPWHLV